MVKYDAEYYARHRKVHLAYQKKYNETHNRHKRPPQYYKIIMPDLYCAFMTGKTSEERGSKRC